MRISFKLNGRERSFSPGQGQNVREMLVEAGFISLRNGCDRQGSCGLCTIIVNGKTVNSCLLQPFQLEGKDVFTIEYYNQDRLMRVIQKAMVDCGVVQCGYCTPAMVLGIRDLVQRYRHPDRDQIKDALSGIFCRCTGYEQFFSAVNLAVKRIKEPDVVKEVAPSFRHDLRVVGKPKAKVDGIQLAQGRRAFVEDRVQPETCYLKMLRSPYPHAYLKHIDTSLAESLPGVVYIATWKNTPEVYYNQAGQGFPEPSPYDRRLFGRKVLHVGDRVAGVVAETEEIANRAIKLIQVQYDVLKPVFNVEDASDPKAPILHNGSIEYAGQSTEGDLNFDPREGKIIYQFPIGADPHSNLAASVSGGIGETETGFNEADTILERTYSTSPVQCTPAEPHVVLTRMEGDRLIIHASTQVPWHLRRIVARVLGVTENRIRVIKEHVGGGFGAKQDIVLEEVAAWCTWVTGRSILFRFNRFEEFQASRTRHPMTIGVRLGAKKDGKLTAIEMKVRANTGPYGSHCLTVPMNGCSKSLPLFLCDHVFFDVKTYYSNIPPTGAYQGYGAPQGSFALQTAVAELAEKLGLDPLEIIEKNRVQDGSMLEILKCLGEGREGVPQEVSSCGLGPAIKKGREWIRWGQREESSHPDEMIGKGMAIVQQGSGLPGLDSANATVTLQSDGTVLLLSGGTDLGTGLDTVTTKMVAECLCIPMDEVSLLAADTDTTPYDDGAYASSGTFFSGSAALKAAEGLKILLLETVADMLKVEKGELDLTFPSAVNAPGRLVPFSEIATYARAQSQEGRGPGLLSFSANFTTDKAAFPYGAHFCQVAVNKRSGKVKIQRYIALQDCGTPINPELALGQIYGGVLKTIGHSLCEEMLLDDKGTCTNADLMNYSVPMIQDLPEDFKAELIETNDPFGPYGGKSIAEISCNGAAPAIANAIHDAVGIWVRSWPFSQEKVLQALKNDSN